MKVVGAGDNDSTMELHQTILVQHAQVILFDYFFFLNGHLIT